IGRLSPAPHPAPRPATEAGPCGSNPRSEIMSWLTAFVLRHKLIVVGFWLVAAVIGVATLKSTSNRLSADFSLPGQPGYIADTTINQLYHNGGGQQPLVVTATAPPGGSARGPEAAAIFTAAGHALSHSRLADQATTGDPHFTTTDGRTGFALVFIPSTGGAFG